MLKMSSMNINCLFIGELSFYRRNFNKCKIMAIIQKVRSGNSQQFSVLDVEKFQGVQYSTPYFSIMTFTRDIRITLSFFNCGCISNHISLLFTLKKNFKKLNFKILILIFFPCIPIVATESPNHILSAFFNLAF